MARVGWVGAQLVGAEPETWYRLSVFDDGWVELPGTARRAAHLRSELRLSVWAAIGGAVLLAVVVLVPRAGLPDAANGAVAAVCMVLLLAGLLVLSVVRLRRATAGMGHARADLAQLRRERAEGRAVRRVPGAPLFRQASSAAELASWLTPVRLIRRHDVGAVVLAGDGDDHLVTVRLTDGAERTYRSPDAALPRLLGGFGSVVDSRRPV